MALTTRSFMREIRDTIRDLVFGMEDGLISNLGLVLGVAAAGAPNSTVLLAGFASMFAGAVSMAAGDYLSTKSQREVLDEQLEEEEKKLSSTKEELKVIRRLYRSARFTEKEIRHFVKHLSANKRLTLKILAEEALGIVPEKYENPSRGAAIIFVAFLAGSLSPILPFFLADTKLASMLSLLATGLVLFAVGAYKTRITNRNWLKSGIEMLIVALLAAAAGYAIGTLLGVQIT